jgi:AraC-like DNA-binding protein
MKLFPDTDEQAMAGPEREIPQTLKEQLIPWAQSEYRDYSFGYTLFQDLKTPDYSIFSWRVESRAELSLLLSSAQPVISLFIILGKSLFLELPGVGQTLFQKGFAYLLYIPKSEIRVFCKPGNTGTIQMELGPALMNDLKESLPSNNHFFREFSENEANALLLKAVPVDWRILSAVKNMQECRYGEGLLLFELKKGISELLCLFLEGLRDQQNDSGSPYIPGKEIYEKIRQHILESPNIHLHSLKNLSRRFGINPGMLSRNFKMLYGMNPSFFVRYHAMEKAKSMILNSTLSIEEIAVETGYSESNNFHPAFKKQFGISPSALRKNFPR